jgi:hypothetical protein
MSRIVVHVNKHRVGIWLAPSHDLIKVGVGVTRINAVCFRRPQRTSPIWLMALLPLRED